ncbi:hypothetical protein [Hydrogenophaga sp.]|uniref:hypothetical protein n=1 Tax=Hydrogenophaga sp. TaxID=1904254 RepID=UPI002720E122|nr:hypothetical protein [Hydrogenophaga sp.]MDO8903974.1 hypothetical protein [Hydrogenophaga sp.]
MTYAELVARLANYLAAEQKILQSQEYTIGQGGTARRNRRADLADVRDEIEKINNLIATVPDNPANRGARRIRYLRPRG